MIRNKKHNQYNFVDGQKIISCIVKGISLRMGMNRKDWTRIDGRGRHAPIINNKEADSNAKRIHKGSTMVAYMANKKIVFFYIRMNYSCCLFGCPRAACTWAVHATCNGQNVHFSSMLLDPEGLRWKEEASLGEYVLSKQGRKGYQSLVTKSRRRRMVFLVTPFSLFLSTSFLQLTSR